MIQKYLNTILEEGDSNDIIVALGHIAKAHNALLDVLVKN